MKILTIQAASGRGERTRRMLRRLTLLAVALVLPQGCSDLLKVNDPDIVNPGDLTDLPTIRAGAVGDFTLAYSGSGSEGNGINQFEGVIMTSGLLADEWVNSETFPDRIAVDARQVSDNSATMQDIFRNVMRARR